jgi:ADP-ribose pyrophosphatase YjhB (NUDIX family)
MEHKKIAAGIIAIDKQTGELLLGKRAFGSKDSNSWAPFGGTFEIKDENPKNCAKREFKEETGSDSEYEMSKSPFFVQDNPRVTFYNYIGLFNHKFTATLDNSEHTNYGWFPIDNLPSNLHPGFADMLSSKKAELEEIIKKIKEHENQ